MIQREVELEGLDWTELAHNTAGWLALVNMVIDLQEICWLADHTVSFSWSQLHQLGYSFCWYLFTVY
jgi:hypothetical protein